MKEYWFGVMLETDWKVGSPWRLVFPTGSVTDEGEVAECDPPRRLALRWRHKWRPELAEEGEAFCVIELEPVGGAVKLTIDHTIARAGSKLIEAVSGGWPSILSNLKSLLETGEVLINSGAERLSPEVDAKHGSSAARRSGVWAVRPRARPTRPARHGLRRRLRARRSPRSSVHGPWAGLSSTTSSPAACNAVYHLMFDPTRRTSVE